MAAARTDGQRHQFVLGRIEPGAGGQQGEHVEEQRCGGQGAGEAGAPFAGGIAGPDGHAPAVRDADGPGIAVAHAGAGLPRHGAIALEVAPAGLFLGAGHFAQGLQRAVDAGRAQGRKGGGIGGVGAFTREQQGGVHIARAVGAAAACVVVQHAGHARIGAGQFPQAAFGPAHDQRKPVVVRCAVDASEAHGAQHAQGAVDAVRAQVAHGGHVQRAGQGLVRRHGAVVALVEVAGREAVVLRGHIGQQHAGGELAGAQHVRVQEGFEQAAGAAAGAHDVHHAGVRGAGAGQVAHVGPYLTGGHVQHQQGAVVHFVGHQALGVARSGLVAAGLQVGVHGGADDAPFTAARLQCAQQVRGQAGQGVRPPGQGLVLGQRAFHAVDVPVGQQAVQQPVALGAQGLLAFAGVEDGGRVGQHGQRGAFTPGEVIGRAAEPAPGRGIQAHHVAAEGRVGRVEREDLRLAHP